MELRPPKKSHLKHRTALLGAVVLIFCISVRAGRGPASDFTIIEPIEGSSLPIHLTFVLTKDFIHAPIAYRKPQGAGPFPAVLFLSGNGGGGMARARWAMLNRGYTMNRFLQAGYVVAYLRYRGEVPLAYRGADKLVARRNSLMRSPLDHDDVISVVDYFKGQS